MTEAEFLIDSNIAIYILRDAGCAASRRVETMASGSVVTSVIAYAEVLRGIPAHQTGALAAARRLFERAPALPFDIAAAATYARLPFKRARFDRLIAAHALALNLTLVTNNERDFADIPDLRVENWT